MALSWYYEEPCPRTLSTAHQEPMQGRKTVDQFRLIVVANGRSVRIDSHVAFANSFAVTFPTALKAKIPPAMWSAPQDVSSL